MCRTEFRGRPLGLAFPTIDVRDSELRRHRGARDRERAIVRVLPALPAPGK